MLATAYSIPCCKSGPVGSDKVKEITRTCPGVPLFTGPRNILAACNLQCSAAIDALHTPLVSDCTISYVQAMSLSTHGLRCCTLQ
jgi:hypothetical protein